MKQIKKCKKKLLYFSASSVVFVVCHLVFMSLSHINRVFCVHIDFLPFFAALCTQRNAILFELQINSHFFPQGPGRKTNIKINSN